MHGCLEPILVECRLFQYLIGIDLVLYLMPRANPMSEYNDYFGLLNSPRGSMVSPLKNGVTWALDNNCFTKNFNFKSWIRALERYQIYQDTCLFVLAPDIVGDKDATLFLYKQYHTIIKEDFGYPVALAIQDGMTKDDIYWEDIDAIFIGGTTEYKFGNDAEQILKHALDNNIHTHVGRVNSRKRVLRFWFVDTVDGTTPIYEPNVKIPMLARAVRDAREMKRNIK